MSEKTLQLRHLLEPLPASVAEARRALGPLEGRISPTLLEELRLLVSELVTNSVQHARMDSADSIELRVMVSGTSVRMEVTDTGAGFEVLDRGLPPPEQASGRGLFVVQRLSDRWGVDREPDGTETRVWLEIDHDIGPRLLLSCHPGQYSTGPLLLGGIAVLRGLV